jgi:CBS domain-containing protein
MRPDIKTVSPRTPVSEVVQLMADAHISGVPVVDTDGSLVGVVSATDVLEAASESEGNRERNELFEQTIARDLMTKEPLTVDATADVREAAQRMLYAEVKRLFVEDGGRLVGVLSQTDIAYAVGTGRI